MRVGEAVNTPAQWVGVELPPGWAWFICECCEGFTLGLVGKWGLWCTWCGHDGICLADDEGGV